MSTHLDHGAPKTSFSGRASRLSRRFRETTRREGLSVALKKVWKTLKAKDKTPHLSLAPVSSAPAPQPSLSRLKSERVYRRQRDFHLKDLLACPDCSSIRLKIEEAHVGCSDCGASYPRSYGTFLFANPASSISNKLEEPNYTHIYSDDSNALIQKYRHGVILDYGAGHTHPDRLHPNVVLHEAVHYDSVDVASLTSRLPYRDNCFDAIISQAVFEHVPRPWEVAAELHRILKPGGEIHLDTAFMQPYHSDPYHFFNMTIPGVREVFRQFKEVRVGVKPYQLPSFGYRMQLEVMLGHMAPGVWHDRMKKLLTELQQDGASFDRSLDENGQLFLAAGVYFHGIK